MKKYSVGFVGAGLQARRRIPFIQASRISEVSQICSKSGKTAKELAELFDINFARNWQEIVSDPAIDIVVIATYPDSHAEITIEALRNGKHVFCEKPLAKSSKEAQLMLNAARKYKRNLKCGFNHRFHPAIFEAKRIIESGKIGKLIFGRGVYGHCGRKDFQKEWRANTKFAAGGILMEQGIHLVDLFSWFFGGFYHVAASISTDYFSIKPLEDNAFVIMKTKKGETVSLHVSNMQWRNAFLFEVYGEDGYVKIEGLNGSYGVETLTVGFKNYDGPFKEEVSEFRGGDQSWNDEWTEFLASFRRSSSILGDGEDGLSAMKLVEAAYKSSKAGKEILV